MRAEGVCTGSADLREDRAEIGLRVEAGAQDGQGAGEHAAVGGSGQIQVGIGHGADAFRIAHANLARGGVQAENRLAAAVAGEAGELDLAAAGLAAEALDGGAILGEDHRAVGVRNPVGHVHNVERRLLELQAAVDLRIAQRAAHGGLRGHAAGGDEVAC